MKLGEGILMFKVLGCFPLTCTVNGNYITNELSSFSQKDGKPICFFHSKELFSWRSFSFKYQKHLYIVTLQFNPAALPTEAG